MKKSILILALCFVLMFVVAAVSAQDAEVPADEPVAEETVEETVDEAVEEADEVVDDVVDEVVDDEPIALSNEAAEAETENAAEETEAADGFTVTYLENDCLAAVPTDEATYQAGDEVTVLFEPVEYKDYLIFYGWDWDDDGIADYGYYYDKFEMPEKDVELKAICIGVSWGRSCRGCHLHGHPGPGGLQNFTPVPYGDSGSGD